MEGLFEPFCTPFAMREKGPGDEGQILAICKHVLSTQRFLLYLP
jgi:hypothetical protein